MTTRTSPSATVAVLEAVADAENADPLDLPPLYLSVETDALESIFQPTPDGNTRAGRVEFTYHDYRVTVDCDADGTATVEAVHRSAEHRSGRAQAEISLD